MAPSAALGPSAVPKISESAPPTSSLPFPPYIHEVVLFALTAFDPPGIQRSLEENTRANGQLYERLAMMDSPSPLHIFRSFGFSLSEGWREDGFVLAFSPQDTAGARQAVVKVAEDFEQGAIFAYGPSTLGPDFVTRTTVPACIKDIAEEKTEMVRISPPPSENTILEREWAGPAMAGR